MSKYIVGDEIKFEWNGEDHSVLVLSVTETEAGHVYGVVDSRTNFATSWEEYELDLHNNPEVLGRLERGLLSLLDSTPTSTERRPRRKLDNEEESE